MVGAASSVARTDHARSLRWRRLLKGIAETGPFFGYLAIFLLLPALIVAKGVFAGDDGTFTFANLNYLADANVRDAMFTSILVSLISGFIGAVVGGAGSYALVALSENHPALRRTVLALSSVLAQFGGVMLAFAFIATIGRNGIITQMLETTVGFEISPVWLSTLPGLITVYCYFQIPLMMIVFTPAVDGLRPQWREATENLGGSTFQYWRHVGLPILWPSFLGSFLLLFANAFSSFATAAALFSQRQILVPLMIQGAMRNEMNSEHQALAPVLAITMIVIVAVVMVLSERLTRRTTQWQ